jgi:hypothetical protein
MRRRPSGGPTSLRVRRSIAAAGLLVLSTVPARAQVLPSQPITLVGGRLTIGGEAMASVSTDSDELGWFNYTDYEHNALRLVRLGATAEMRLGSRLALLGELRTENWDRIRPYALYVRIRPWVNRPFDIQAGRIPPTFGAFARRNYAGTDNPLIGYPLAYQYLTSLRPDAVPETADDVLRMRGRGWRPSFPIGSTAIAPGVPLVSAFQWDTGVQVHVGSQTVEASVALTTGTLSAPLVKDNNRGKQVAGRVAWHPAVGLTLGASGARGPYLANSVIALLPASQQQRDFTQRAFGFDAEYSRDYWLVRTEGVLSQWRLPAIGAPAITDPLRAWSVSVEGRYKLRPGLFVAGRYDRLGFSELRGSTVALAWDAPLTRVETGGGYYLLRNLIAKVTYQHDWRDGGVVRDLSVWSGQLQFWF